MLNISESTKNSIMNGSQKTYLIKIGDSIYNSSNLVSDSIEIKESICSSELLQFNQVEKNQIKLSLIDFQQSIRDSEGKVLEVIQTINSEDIPLGKYIIGKPEIKNDNLVIINAYDFTVKFDKDISTLWNDTITFPITHRNLLIAICNYCGIEHDIPSTYTNSDFLINQSVKVENTPCSLFIGFLQELSGCFFKPNRQGILKLLELKNQKYKYPSNSLFPSNNLFIDLSSSQKYQQNMIINSSFAEFKTMKIDKLQIKGNENDIGIIVGVGENTYIIESNQLTYGYTGAELRPTAFKIFNKIKDISYTPFNANLIGFPYVEIGDSIQIKTAKNTIDSFVFNRTLKGTGFQKDRFETKGRLKREIVKSINKSIQVLNQKTLEITQNVEKLEFKMIDVADGLQSQITQTAKGVTIQSQQFAYRNILVNSDFKFITDNKLDCWLDYNTGKLNKTIIDDDDFPNGYALQLKKNEVVSDVIYQEFDINKNIGGLFLALDIKPIILNYSIRGIIYVKYENEGFNAVFSNESYQPELNVYKRIKFTFNLDKNKKVETIGVRPFNITSEISDVLINRVFLTYDTPYPMVDMWNDIPSNYLIPTLNLSPKGSALLQANKVDIKGFTTIYNPDGSSYTQIDGSTIRTANLVGLKTVNGTVVNATGDISVFNWDGSIIKFRFENGIVVGWQYVAGSKKGMVNQSYLIVKNNQIYCQKWYDGNGGEISGEKPVVVYNGLLFASGEI